MKDRFKYLLNLKLGCHKNNKNVKKLSAMLKKYPKAGEGRFTENCFKGEKQNGRNVPVEADIGSNMDKYT